MVKPAQGSAIHWAARRAAAGSGGEIVEQGTPAEVIDNPQAARTRAFLRQVSGSVTPSMA